MTASCRLPADIRNDCFMYADCWPSKCLRHVNSLVTFQMTASYLLSGDIGNMDTLVVLKITLSCRFTKGITNDYLTNSPWKNSKRLLHADSLGIFQMMALCTLTGVIRYDCFMQIYCDYSEWLLYVRVDSYCRLILYVDVDWWYSKCLLHAYSLRIFRIIASCRLPGGIRYDCFM